MGLDPAMLETAAALSLSDGTDLAVELLASPLFQTRTAVNDAPFRRAACGGRRRRSLTAVPVCKFRNQELDGEVRSAAGGGKSVDSSNDGSYGVAMIGTFTRRTMLAACWTLALAFASQAFDGDNFGGSSVAVIANLDPVSGTVTFRSRGESVAGQIGRPTRVETPDLLANLKEGDEVSYFSSRRCNCITGIDKIFRGVAVIAALDPVSGRVTLDHEAIAGFMDAQETSYRVDKVDAPRFFANLKSGDKVEFIAGGKSYSIVKGYFYRILRVSDSP